MSRQHLIAATAAGALLLAGCGAVNAGTAVEEEFTEHITSAHGEHLLETRVNSSNDLPFAGGASASVVLRPDTPPEVFANVLDDVVTFEPSQGDYDGVGVVANGVGVCPADPQVDAKQALRDALYAGGSALEGEWACPPSSHDDPVPYSGTVTQLDRDLDIVREVGGGSGLRLEASLDEPVGTVAGEFDAVPDTLGETLTAVAQADDIERFELVDGDLVIAISPTADSTAAQAAADAAAGPELLATVVLGSTDPAEQQQYAALGPLLDQVRDIPGVEGVGATTSLVTLRTLDATRVSAIHDAAVAHPEFDDALTLVILVGGGTGATGAAEYTRPRGAQSEGIALFQALVTHPGVSHARVREAAGGRARWITVDLSGPLTDLADLRSELPVGVTAQVSSDQDDRSVRFTIADRLSEEDLSSFHEDVDRAAIVDAWNAAG